MAQWEGRRSLAGSTNRAAIGTAAGAPKGVETRAAIAFRVYPSLSAINKKPPHQRGLFRFVMRLLLTDKQDPRAARIVWRRHGQGLFKDVKIGDSGKTLSRKEAGWAIERDRKIKHVSTRSGFDFA